MPSATPFTTLNRWNGFPFCVSRVDVSLNPSHDPSVTDWNWVTLGGVSSGTATQAQINTSLIRAMQIYWNFYGFQGDFSASSVAIRDGVEDFSSEIEATDKEVFIKKQGETNALQPYRRNCEGSIIGGSFSDQDPEQEPGQPRVLQKSGGFIRCLSGNFSIIKMYNGSVGDESNFVGYGAKDLLLVRGFSTTKPSNSSSSRIEASVRTDVGSIIAGKTEDGEDPNNENRKFDQVASAQTVGGFPFRAMTRCEALIQPSDYDDPEITKTYGLDPSTLSGTIEARLDTQLNPDPIPPASEIPFSIETDISVSLNTSSVSFFTY